jgi:phosphate transport system permease protein
VVTTLQSPPRPQPADPDGSTLVGGRLPGWAPVASAGVALAATAGLAMVSPLSGVAGTAVVTAIVFLVLQTAWSYRVEGRRRATDRFATTLVYASFLLAIVPLVWILAAVVIEGLQQFNLAFLTNDMRGVTPRREGGGVLHGIVGTLQQVGLAALVAVPIAVLTAIYLVEYANRSKLSRFVSFFVDVMTGIPSIVSGLFIYTFWILIMGFPQAGLAGAMALSILMIPVVVRSTEEMLKLVPRDLREASYALGVPKWRTILKIVLPTALAGIVTGIMLGLARVMGETAPLLLTTFYSSSLNTNPTNGPQASIPFFIWDQVQSGTPASVQRAWAGALTLILLVMILNLLARLIARRTRVRA